METPIMIAATPASLRRAFGIAVSAAAAFALSACANSGSMMPAAQGSGSQSSPSSSSGFTFYTVDYPKQSPNRVTGIADNQEIVGVYGDGGSQNTYHSYTSNYAGSQPYSQFANDDYPNSPSTYMSSIMVSKSGGIVQSGYAVVPYTLQGVWGVFNNKGLWTLVQKHSGEGKCHMMELFGLNSVNSSYYSVGFYWHDDSPPSGNCSKHTQYVTELRPGEGFHDFSINGASPTAGGVTKDGYIAGSTDNSGNGPSQGWTKAVCNGCRGGVGATRYWNYNLDSHRSTMIYGVNNAGVVVGTYEDANDNWHGFIATQLFPLSGTPTWATVDEPSGIGTNTAISGIDNNGDICGWYTGSDGKTHGFVGIYNK